MDSAAPVLDAMGEWAKEVPQWMFITFGILLLGLAIAAMAFVGIVGIALLAVVKLNNRRALREMDLFMEMGTMQSAADTSSDYDDATLLR